MQLEHRLSVLLQQHLHCWLNTCLQWIGHRQPQDETRNIQVLGFAVPYIRGLTVYTYLAFGLQLNLCPAYLHLEMYNKLWIMLLVSVPHFTTVKIQWRLIFPLTHWSLSILLSRFLALIQCVINGVNEWNHCLVLHHWNDGYAPWKWVTFSSSMIMHVIISLHHYHHLNTLSPGRFEWNLRLLIFSIILEINGWAIFVHLPSNGCHWTLLKISQHWFR